jgi:hypothetical protein
MEAGEGSDVAFPLTPHPSSEGSVCVFHMATHDWNPEAHGCEKLRYSKYKIVHVIN